MKPRVTIITIGVDDLDRSLRFYRDGLGFPTRGIVGTEYEHGAVAFFDLTNGQKLAIWARRDLAHEAKVPLGPRSASEFSLGHNVDSKAEVDAVIDQAHAPEQRSPIRLTKRFGVVTPDRFKILTGICGKSRGIRK